MKVEIEVIEASMFQNVNNSVRIKKQIRKPYLIIGRGLDLQKIENQEIEYLQLRNFGKSISRKHAQILFPLDCFRQDFNKIPSYYRKFKGKWSQLTNQLLKLIRQYSKSDDKIKIRNMKSKYGLFTQLNKLQIINTQYFQFGNFNFKITKINLQNRTLQQYFQQQHQKYQQQQINRVILGNIQQNLQFSVLKGQYKNNQQKQIVYFLGQKDISFTIGRLGTCDLQINRSQLSRKQGIFSYVSQSRKWYFSDGIPNKKSTNGSWQKIQKIDKSFSKFMNKEQLFFKLGQVGLRIRVHYDEFTQTSNILEALNEDDFTNY